MDEDWIRGLGFLVTLLFLLAIRRKQKEAGKRREEMREYTPLEPEKGDLLPRAQKAASAAFRAYSMILAVGLLIAVIAAAIFEPMSRWIILGTVVLVILIYLLFRRRDAGGRPDPYDTDHHRWEDWH